MTELLDWLDWKDTSLDSLTVIFEDSEHGIIARVPAKELEALIDKRETLARIEELKKVGCCDYWEEGCSLNVCHGEQLTRILELEALSDKHSSKGK